MTPAPHLVVVALVTQAILAGVGILGLWVMRVPVPPLTSHPVRDAVLGLVAAAALGAVNYAVLHRPRGPWRAVRSAVDDVLVPTFAGMSGGEIAVVSVAAGVGEELFFRGCLQSIVGFVPAAIAFGLAHVAGARMAAFGVWAMVMGVVLGGLFAATGGLLASMTAHACYDLLAFRYLGAEARRREWQGA